MIPTTGLEGVESSFEDASSSVGCLGSVATGGGGGTACTGPAGMTATLRAARPPRCG